MNVLLQLQWSLVPGVAWKWHETKMHDHFYTFLVSPAGDKAERPSRLHGPSCGQTDGADLPRHVDRLGQMHQGYVIGDVGAILLVDEPLVADDTIHLIASLFWGNVHGGVHVVLPQTHAPEVGLIQRAGKQVDKWKCILSRSFQIVIVW